MFEPQKGTVESGNPFKFSNKFKLPYSYPQRIRIEEYRYVSKKFRFDSNRRVSILTIRAKTFRFDSIHPGFQNCEKNRVRALVECLLGFMVLQPWDVEVRPGFVGFMVRQPWDDRFWLRDVYIGIIISMAVISISAYDSSLACSIPAQSQYFPPVRNNYE